jgi:sigma-B regulation protein RsbU (phosphoserine phosphatase)
MNVLVDTVQGSEPVAADRAGILECTLLIADDDPLCRRLLAVILQKQGFTKFLFAEGGHSALQQIEHHQPDLVLLDMQMPDLSGLDVCKRIRAQPSLIDIPILMQTATVDRKQMGVMFAAGASDFLSKPINPSELIARVITHLERQCLLRELRPACASHPIFVHLRKLVAISGGCCRSTTARSAFSSLILPVMASPRR